jgi:hypothetical protein
MLNQFVEDFTASLLTADKTSEPALVKHTVLE